jgi:carbamoyltransferase
MQPANSKKPIYILGTGLSHNGSSCLLKDGKIIVAIEKERLSRVKHDGGNDFLTVQYCLQQAGITVNDLSLVVQVANFEKENILKHKFIGKRFFAEDCTVPFVTISHHLAHAYSAVGTSPYNECNVLVIDGCGSPYHHCEDLRGAVIPPDVNSVPGLYAEKDSYYYFNGQYLLPIYKDFSVIELFNRKYPVQLPTSSHSIGGFYSMVSNYCFGNLDDAGKLMGLAPYGREGVYTTPIFSLENGRVYVIEEVLALFDKPMHVEQRPFTKNFQYYADIAKWVQTETQKAIQYIFSSRLAFNKHEHICYAGGVALNAVANTQLLHHTDIKSLYIEPAAGDNGLALGCAFYGWIEVLKQPKIPHNGSTLFGASYTNTAIEEAINQYKLNNPDTHVDYAFSDGFIDEAAGLLAEGKIIGWFQQGAEFGPRALGSRSILADPRKKNVQQLINRDIKFREDFRPFAPAVLQEEVNNYFEYGHDSPYMILIDRIKPEWKEILSGIVHVDGTCRVQTVSRDWNTAFYTLLTAFKAKTGIAVLLNTSFNKKGMPIVETPYEAIDFFYQCRLDVLILNNYLIKK